MWTGNVYLANDLVTKPLTWKKPRRVFVNSMGDLFHESIPDRWIDQVFAVMALCPQHTFQVLTKRAERMRDYFLKRQYLDVHPLEDRELAIDRAMNEIAPAHWHRRELQDYSEEGLPLPNVWLGVSAERQQEADERIPLLLDTPAAVRFVSLEPLLGPIDLSKRVGSVHHHPDNDLSKPETRAAINEVIRATRKTLGPSLDWVIVGGESGRNARPMHPDWARSLRDQCRAAAVPFFFKQWGEWYPLLDRDLDDPDWRRPYATTYGDRGKRTWLNLAGGRGFHGQRFHVMQLTGKKYAGRHLDGREWNEFPAARP